MSQGVVRDPCLPKTACLRLSPNKKFKSFENCITSLFIGGIGESSLDTMIYSGSFVCFEKTKKFMIVNLKDAIGISKDIYEEGNYSFTPNCIINEETKEEKGKVLEKQFD